MRAVFQRVNSAKVSIDKHIVASTGPGAMILLAVGWGDTQKDAEYMADKVAGLRVFEVDGKMQESLLDTKGQVLVVSQFTLYGDCKKGRRPGFEKAARPDVGNALYQHFVARLKGLGLHVETGVFGAYMQVELVNDGPVTILLSSEKEF